MQSKPDQTARSTPATPGSCSMIAADPLPPLVRLAAYLVMKHKKHPHADAVLAGTGFECLLPKRPAPDPAEDTASTASASPS